MKNFLLKFKYLLIGLGLALSTTAYAINVTVPQSTQKADVLVGNANGTYRILNVGANGQCLLASSTTASGLVWGACASGATGITTLNAQTGATQLFATTTSGTVFTISSSGDTHTFTFPASPTFTNLTYTGQGTFALASGTSLSLSGNLWVTGQTSLGNASSTALTVSGLTRLASTTITGTLNVTGTSTLATTSIPALSNLTSNGFVKTSGGNGLLSVDTSTYLTGNQTITLSGDVSGSGETAITTAIGNDKVTEAMLKVVDTPTDEDILTYESTTGDFEWHTPAQLNIPNYAYASSAYATLWNLTPGSNITITTTTVPTIAVSSTPTFTTLSTGQGQYELYAMDQDVLTSSNVTFANASTTNLSVATNAYLTNIASGNCLQTGAGGLITSAGAACGSGSGNSAWTILSGVIHNATSTDLVGIGTSTPDNTLTVAGDLNVNGTGTYKLKDTTFLSYDGTDWDFVHGWLTINDLTGYTHTDGLATFGTRVGINSTTAASQLTITGTGIVNPMIISSSSGATLFKVDTFGSTTIANLTAASCDVKSTTGGSLYCGTDQTGASTGNAAFTIGSGLIYNATSTDSVLIGTSTPTTATAFIQGSGSKNALTIASSTGTTMFQVEHTGSTSITVPDTANVVGLTVTQNATGNINAINIVNASTGRAINMLSSQAGATGVEIETYQNSASPAANDLVLIQQAYGNNASSTKLEYGSWNVILIDPTTASEDSEIAFNTYLAGSSATRFIIGNSLGTPINGIGVGATSAAGVVSSNGSQDIVIQTGNSTTGSIQIVDGANGNILFDPNGTGNIGINTTTPSATLHLQGAGAVTPLIVSSSSGTSLLTVASNGSTTLSSLASAGCVAATATGSLYITSCGGGSVTGTGTNGYTARWSSASALTTGALLDNGTVAGVNATSSTISLNVQGSGTLDPFNVSSSSGTSFLRVTQAGNIGIGTTTPLNNISLAGENIEIGLYSDTGVQTLSIASDRSSGWSEVLSTSPGGSIYFDLFSDAGNTYFQLKDSTVSGDILLNTAADSYLNTTFDFGIGTTTPAYKLTVVGTAGNNPVLNVASSTGVSMLHVGANGRVGIGTTTPQGMLDILDTSSNTQPSILYIGGTTTPSTTKLGCLALYDDAAKLYVYVKFVSGAFSTSTSASFCQ